MHDKYPENDYRNYLSHSAKGDTWANHKYLYIDANGRYIYPEDVRQMGAKNAVKGFAGYAKRGLSATANRAKAAVAGLSSKNRERSAYRKTGLTKTQRDRQLYRETGRTGIAGRTTKAISSIKNRALSALSTTKSSASNAAKNVNRKIYRKTGVNVGESARGAANKATNAAKRLTPKNLNRKIYRKTGVNVGESASKARSSLTSTFNNAVDAFKKKKRSAYRKTGWRILK